MNRIQFLYRNLPASRMLAINRSRVDQALKKIERSITALVEDDMDFILSHKGYIIVETDPQYKSALITIAGNRELTEAIDDCRLIGEYKVDINQL